MKTTLLVISILLVHFACIAQQSFQSAIGGWASDVGRTIIKTSDGGYAICGITYSYGIDSGDVYVVKLSSTGSIQWTRTVGGPGYDEGSSIIQTYDGGYAITGRTGYWTFEVYTIKLDAAGNLQWTSKVSNGLFDKGYGLVQTSDSGYAISARTYDGFAYSGYIVKLNSAGGLQNTYSLSGFVDGAYSIIRTNDGGYALSGFITAAGAGGPDLYIVKLDGSFNLQWKHTVGGSGNDMCYPATKVIQTKDNGYAITGITNSYGAGNNDVYVVKFSSTGALQWTRTVGGTGTDEAAAIIQTADNGYAIAGVTDSYGAGNSDAYIVKLDSTGALTWTRTAGGTGFDGAYSIVQADDSSYMLTGSTTSYGSGSGDIYVVKLKANGTVCGNSSSGGIAGTGGVAGNNGGFIGASSGVAGSGGYDGSGGALAIICSCTSVATITPSGSVSFCSGGSILLSANTGAGNTYQWKNNGTNITGATSASYSAAAAGSYTVVVTNACGTATSAAVTVTVNALPNASVTAAGATTFCAGGSATLNAVIAANRNYQWKKNGNIIAGATSASYVANASGTYKVTVTNTITSCSKTTGAGIVVTKNALPAATITPQGPTTFCAGGSVVLAANTGAGLTYKWKKGNNYIAGATASNYTATAAGTYKVEVKNSNGCTKTSSGVIVSVPCKEGELISSLIPIAIGIDFTVYPNPNSGEFIIKFSEVPATSLQIELTDETGRIVKKFETIDETISIKESNLAKGIYYLHVKTNTTILGRKIISVM